MYPGIAVARALESELAARDESLTLLYVGICGRVDEVIVPREGIEFRAVSAGPLRVSSPLAAIRNIARLALGVVQSLSIVWRYKPDAVFATGGYASVPVGVAARVLRRPLVIFLPDVTPGWAVRLLSRLATTMTTTSERALEYLPRARTIVTGYPIRDSFWTLDRASARAALGLPADAQVLLVTAGSLGAQRINAAVFGALPALLERCIVLHVTGEAGEVEAGQVRASLPPALQERYIVRGYLDAMPAAMHAADVVVARAGASSLGELPAAGAPAILVPGEYDGWSQAPNAEYMQVQGAAVVLRNAELDRLSETVLSLLADQTRLDAMRAASRALARPDAARALARTLMAVAA